MDAEEAEARLRLPGWHGYVRAPDHGTLVAALTECSSRDEAVNFATREKVRDPRLNAWVTDVDSEGRLQEDDPVLPDLPAPVSKPGPVPVDIVEYASDGSMPVSRHDDAEMFEVPAAATLYWRDQARYVVRSVSDDVRPVVALVLDQERSHEVAQRLPVGWRLTAGRDSGTGLWHANLFRDGVCQPPPEWSVISGDAAVERALSRLRV